LKVEPAAFDKRFDAYLRERFGEALAGLDEFRARLAQGRAAFERKQYDAALPALERANAIFPQFGGDGSPYWYLAMIYKEKGDTRRAADELGRLVALNETDYRAYLELAELREKLGDAKGAAAALDGAMYINPFEPAAHKRLAELYRAAGEPAKVVRERKALVALDPVDRSDALYELAVAQRAAGDAAAARKSVLRALEDAPNFEKAQTLLLTLYEERTAGRKP
jgi:tetratricopeptide (TPR) repeat protein